MLSFIEANLTTILAVTGVVAVIAAAVISLVRGRKKGSTACTGNCACCKMNCSSK